MIDITKKYRTRDGQIVFDLKSQGGMTFYTVRGCVGCSDRTHTWTREGKFLYGFTEPHALDLVEVVEEKPVEPTPEPKKDWPQFDPTKQYTTRNGKPFRYYASDGGGEFPIHGAIWNESDREWYVSSWTACGRSSTGLNEGDDDLIEVKPRIKREYWVNLYPTSAAIHIGKGFADGDRSKDCIACVKVVIDCEHGEGL